MSELSKVSQKDINDLTATYKKLLSISEDTAHKWAVGAQDAAAPIIRRNTMNFHSQLDAIKLAMADAETETKNGTNK